MIIGIGTDIVNIERIRSLFLKYDDAFLNKNFHEREIEIFSGLPEKEQVNFLAKRFAAKEAVSKALGTGIGINLAFCDIATLNKESGAPYVLISKEKLPEIEKYNIQISLADDDPFAVAFVVISE